MSRVDPVDPDGMESVTLDVEHVGMDVHLVGAVGEALLAYDNPNSNSVVRSTDLGVTWEAVSLPGAPSLIDLRVHFMDGMAVIGTIGDTDDPGRPYLWTTVDGLEWRGGPAEGTVPTGGVRQVNEIWRRNDGRFVALVMSVIDEIVAVVVSDDGVSWRVDECPPENLIDSVCTPIETIGDLSVTGGIWGGDAVSLDGGRRWQAPTLDPDPAEGSSGRRGPAIRSAVELPDGGWLGTAVSADLGFLIRSEDGVRWEQLVGPGPCEEMGRPNAGSEASLRQSRYEGPVPFGDRWLVVYNCFIDGSPRRSEFVMLDADGTNPVLVEGSRIAETEVSYGSLVAIGGAVITHTEQFEVPTGDALLLRP